MLKMKHVPPNTLFVDPFRWASIKNNHIVMMMDMIVETDGETFKVNKCRWTGHDPGFGLTKKEFKKLLRHIHTVRGMSS